MYDSAVGRQDALATLRSEADAVKALAATALYLFGSTARDEASARSDLDLSSITTATANLLLSTWSASNSFWSAALARRSTSRP
jgi:predicted nucleotidyltransferase